MLLQAGGVGSPSSRRLLNQAREVPAGVLVFPPPAHAPGRAAVRIPSI